MRIKLNIAILGVLMAISGCASTNAGKTLQERMVVIDGKNIEVTDVFRVTWSDDKILKVSDFGNGVYVSVHAVFGGGPYKNLENIVKNYLITKGIKISDKVEGSDLAVRFSIGGSPNLADAESKAAYSNLPNTDQVVINSGALVAGVASAGPTAVIGFAIGAMLNIDKEAIVGSTIIRKPIYFKNAFGREAIKSAVEDGEFNNLIKIKYRLEKDKEAGDDIVFKMIVNQWGNRFILPEQKSTQPITQK